MIAVFAPMENWIMNICHMGFDITSYLVSYLVSVNRKQSNIIDSKWKPMENWIINICHMGFDITSYPVSYLVSVNSKQSYIIGC